MLIDTLNLINEEMFYSGCVIAEIRDYRIAACLNNYETRFVLLQPTQQVCRDACKLKVNFSSTSRPSQSKTKFT